MTAAGLSAAATVIYVVVAIKLSPHGDAAAGHGRVEDHAEEIQALADFLAQAQRLQARVDEVPIPVEDHNTWVQTVEDYLRTRLGPGYMVRFSDFSGMTFFGEGTERSQMSRSLQGRARRLHEFISELQR